MMVERVDFPYRSSAVDPLVRLQPSINRDGRLAEGRRLAAERRNRAGVLIATRAPTQVGQGDCVACIASDVDPRVWD